jgi:tartrate dehydrogenase/decarboxylase / D-malate dehydrogenase
VSNSLPVDSLLNPKKKRFSIAVIAGDGIGPEVISCALRALNRLGDKFDFQLQFKSYDWGAEYYFRHGRMMPENALEQLKKADAILLGAVGDPRIPDYVTLNGLLLPIRRAFDQFANVRPAILYPGVLSPLRNVRAGDIDMVIVRENTEGEYSQVGGFVHQETPDEVAVQTSVFTRNGIERAIRFAFELAVERKQKNRVTSVTKSNAQAFGMVLWDRIFDKMKAEYPNVETESLLVDAAAMNFIRRPQTFDVVVASNLFGDILSDLSAAVTGGIGLAPSANLDPLRRFPSMFEPVHGSAPDIAGKGVANPIASFFSAAMMLKHLELHEPARILDLAARQLLAEGRVRTPDLGGTNNTEDVLEGVLELIDKVSAS